MSSTEVALDAKAVIRDPGIDDRTQQEKYYCTETEWRDFTQLVNQSDFPTSMIIQCLEDATEQVKKDGFYFVQKEHVTADSEGRYFTSRRYFANAYSREDRSIKIRHGIITKYDITVWESEGISASASSIFVVGARRNMLMNKLPYSAITEIDPINGYFKLASGYPTSSNKQVLVSYYACGKAMEDIGYELKRACIEMVTILALKKLKTKRLKKGTVSYTLGKQTITRDEAVFDALVDNHKKEYESWINWFRPFIGKRVRIGRMETGRNLQSLSRY
jgi:hypothetical protein